MKKFLFLITFLAFAMNDVYAQGKVEAPVIAMKLQIKDSLLIEGKTISFTKVIEDSRCPKNVECVWAGQIAITVEVLDENGVKTSKTISFQGQEPKPIASAFTIALKNYDLKFLDVVPYPEASTSIKSEQYKVLLAKYKKGDGDQ